LNPSRSAFVTTCGSSSRCSVDHAALPCKTQQSFFSVASVPSATAWHACRKSVMRPGREGLLELRAIQERGSVLSFTNAPSNRRASCLVSNATPSALRRRLVFLFPRHRVEEALDDSPAGMHVHRGHAIPKLGSIERQDVRSLPRWDGDHKSLEDAQILTALAHQSPP